MNPLREWGYRAEAFYQNNFGERVDNLGARSARVGGAWKSYRGSWMHQAGMDSVKQELGIGKQTLKLGAAGKWLGRGFVAYSVYSGYKEGGAWGAVKGGATHMATTYAFGIAQKALGIGSSWPMMGMLAGVGVGAGLTYYGATGIAPWQALARPLVREHMKKYNNVEMGRPIVDQFGSLATMRQRSLMAIQNSKINGRSALGNEATLQYSPYFR